MITMFSFCLQNIKTYNNYSTIYTNNSNVPLSLVYWNNNSNINTISTYNIQMICSCGSRKKTNNVG